MSVASIEHIIYAPVPYRGYSFRAKSRGASLDSFKNAFKDWLIPFNQTIISSNFLERVLVGGKAKIYLARVFQAPELDELKRSGAVSHIVELDLSLFSKIPIGLVDSSMANFIERNGVPTGEMDPLNISLEFKEDKELNMVREKISRDVARKILEISSNERFKMFIVYRGSERDVLSFGLARIISRVFPRGLIVASENIKSDVLLLYDGALIVGRYLPPWARIKGWNIINLEGEESSLDKIDKSIEEVLRQIYG